MKAGGAMADCESEKTIRYEEDGWSVTLTSYRSLGFGGAVAAWMTAPGGMRLHAGA